MKENEIQELRASFGIVTSFLFRGKRIRGWVNQNIRPADV